MVGAKMWFEPEDGEFILSPPPKSGGKKGGGDKGKDGGGKPGGGGGVGNGGGNWSGGGAQSLARAFWRVVQDNSQGGAGTSLAEVEIRDSYGGADLASGGTAFASAEDVGAAANAFADDGDTTRWAVSAGGAQHIGYELSAPAIVKEVLITARATPTNQAPYTGVRVEKSKNGSSYEVAWQAKHNFEALWQANEPRILFEYADMGDALDPSNYTVVEGTSCTPTLTRPASNLIFQQTAAAAGGKALITPSSAIDPLGGIRRDGLPVSVMFKVADHSNFSSSTWNHLGLVLRNTASADMTAIALATNNATGDGSACFSKATGWTDSASTGWGYNHSNWTDPGLDTKSVPKYWMIHHYPNGHGAIYEGSGGTWTLKANHTTGQRTPADGWQYGLALTQLNSSQNLSVTIEEIYWNRYGGWPFA